MTTQRLPLFNGLLATIKLRVPKHLNTFNILIELSGHIQQSHSQASHQPVNMLFKRLFFAALAATSASARVSKRDDASGRFQCGTSEPSAEHVGMSKILAAQEARAAKSGGDLTTRATINVGVYFHVVASSQTVAGGYLTVSAVLGCMAMGKSLQCNRTRR